MKKNMKKIITMTIIVAMMIFGTSSAYASVSSINEDMSIQLQVNSLIETINEDSLKVDAMNNAIDYSVPLSIRENIVVSADFIPIVGVAQDAIKLKVNSTVQKVGEVVHKNGDMSNVYVVAVAASEVRTDNTTIEKNGIQAWAYVTWIDNLGVNNQLKSVRAIWDPKDKVVNNREVKYGVSDVVSLLWYGTPTTKTTTLNDVSYSDSTYTGFTLRCETSINVVNVGTVKCNAISTFGN